MTIRPRSFVAVALVLGTLHARAELRAQALEGLVNIRFQLDPRVFGVMAAANAAGFDLDAGEVAPGSVRARVRERLTRLDPGLRARLGEFYAARDPEHDPLRQQSKYVSFALLVGAPPGFELVRKPEDLPEDAAALVGFERLVAEVWRGAALGELWERLRPDYVREVEAIRPEMRGMIVETLGYMKTEARVALDRKVAFIPDLLNGFGVVNARNVVEDYYVLVGPSRSGRRPLRAIRHEYLHFMIDPLVVKYAARLPEPEPFLKSVRGRSKLDERYRDDFPLVVTESLIQALDLRLEHKAGTEKAAALVSAFEAGLILAPFFDEELAGFESARLSLQESFPELVQKIRWEREKRRAEAVSQLARQAADTPPAFTSEQRERLVRANEMLAAGQFDAARRLLEEALALEPENASALFGLAQIAGRAEDFPRALELYARAAAASGSERWIAAWSLVRRGNILAFQGRGDDARAEWRRALELEGDLRGAREAAERALASKPQPF